ncbi:hypothetical protein Murru_1579 [Allomuricauda ruestringensis DSM 13258]|uniref:Uncharacterized protein n=1 Tax=Allomuricauda ruestringensis (strain DSM 13258 / CIP 107369 / LMG 19739 / B1) TaxID=886377 RepID=G2PI46_ALLRU|nr:hypothetical protein Murru_1579 [Allomuricauda ruestringensis DSM 13258]
MESILTIVELNFGNDFLFTVNNGVRLLLQP